MANTNDRQLFEVLRKQESLRKLRDLMGPLLGRPVWWLCARVSERPKNVRHSVSVSNELWGDSRWRQPRQARALFKQCHATSRSTHPRQVVSRRFGRVWILPIKTENNEAGSLLLSGVEPRASETLLRLLSEHLNMILDGVLKTEELARLSATIRPRAVALSTVHTVHRIINSTLNLDELVSRLAHLTAQVLRVHRCKIHLLDTQAKKKKTPVLICKARVGFPRSDTSDQSVPMGRGLEGRVAKNADIQLRKKVLCIPLIDEDVIGVVTVHGKKDKKDFNHFDLEILTTLAEEAVIAIKNAQLYEEQRRVTLGTIQSLALVLGSRGVQNSLMTPETFARLAIRTAQELTLNEEQVQALHYAALLKETTKIGIPDEILRKPAKLTGAELSTLRSHTIQGAKIVQNFESLKTVAPIILYSREKFDGTGYPEGLKGEAIPIGARILSVINAFEAIITGRPYRGQSSRAEAIQELEKNRGTQFDPAVVEAFVRALKRENVPKRLAGADSQ